jgi:hypothetical protein
MNDRNPPSEASSRRPSGNGGLLGFVRESLSGATSRRPSITEGDSQTYQVILSIILR